MNSTQSGVRDKIKIKAESASCKDQQNMKEHQESKIDNLMEDRRLYINGPNIAMSSIYG